MQPPSPVGEKVSQVGTLFYFGFFLLMPWWSRKGEMKAVPRARGIQAALKLEKTTMKKLILTLVAAVGFACSAQPEDGGIAWDKATISTTNTASLQNGARIFVSLLPQLPFGCVHAV